MMVSMKIEKFLNAPPAKKSRKSSMPSAPDVPCAAKCSFSAAMLMPGTGRIVPSR